MPGWAGREREVCAEDLLPGQEGRGWSSLFLSLCEGGEVLPEPLRRPGRVEREPPAGARRGKGGNRACEDGLQRPISKSPIPRAPPETGCPGPVESGRSWFLHSSFPLAGSLERDAMGVVDEPVQDGIGQGRIADMLDPVFNGNLGGDDGGGDRLPILQHL